MTSAWAAWVLVGAVIGAWVVLNRVGAGPAQFVGGLRRSRLWRVVAWLGWAWLGWHLLVR
ncbi:hypothetical protein Afer_1464 [Acidimicrobium ferrooxidans DSM 10331]|uniref:Uncharacterized protein n=1 Tax=Acidimicrobium ferrooxidans (strain DSM 10331 / JCM 15462 / NBRC 103882 / ICP) TaxID=525909 RepID=C7M079_ACIFD|nr:hypothetical protein [Acidimicrobium ferrooxidans]ACU54387.1 hypothetical protein Afer_1464 [Acidimicrobium ferrooxidans DSM 10331]